MEGKVLSAGNRKKGLVFATIAYSLWGLSYLFARVALETAVPAVMLAVRFTIAAALMTVYMLAAREKISLRGKRVGRLLALGLLEPAISFYLESYGILWTNASFAGIMVAMNPIVSFFLAIVLLKEDAGPRQKIFMAVSVVGVVIATFSGQMSGVIRPLGVFLLVCSCFANAFSRIINRSVSAEFTPFERTYAAMLLSCVVFTLMSLVQCAGDPQLLLVPLRTPSFLLSALGLGALCSFGAFHCSNIALTELPVSRISVFSGLCTVVSLITGSLVLHEPVTIFSIIGAALIIISIWNVNR